MAQASNSPPRRAGQPFTLGGVARYAHAHSVRLLAGAVVFAMLAGASFALCFSRCLSPVLEEAVAALPEQGAIRNGQLIWPPSREPLLGANAFLSIAAAPEPAPPNTSVDFALQFTERELVVHSLLGAAHVSYPPGWTIELNRRVLAPLWGAWSKPAVLALVFAAVIGMPVAWGVLALPYAVIVSGLGALLGKNLNFGGAWKLSVAAQWPGALLMSFMLALYALAQTSLVLVAGAFAAHFAMTILYLFFSPIFLPQAGSNPFATDARRSTSGRNPFGGAEPE